MRVPQFQPNAFSPYSRKTANERGATAHIVGEPKTPNAMCHAKDQFFEWARQPPPGNPESATVAADGNDAGRTEAAKPETTTPLPKQRRRFLLDAVALLASGTSEGKVSLAVLGQYLKHNDPAFSPKTYGHSVLLSMVRTYDLLSICKGEGSHWFVGLAAKFETTT